MEASELYIKQQGMPSVLIWTKYSFGRGLFMKRADKTEGQEELGVFQLCSTFQLMPELMPEG